MKIKNGDFIELDYIGKIKETNEIFDITNEALAKEKGLYNKNMHYGPIIICIGEHDVVSGLDSNLLDKEPGQYSIDLKPEEAFGKKNVKLLKLVPFAIFKKQEIMPVLGLQVNIDGIIGKIRSVSGGRVIVDFNHPLAGKNIIYEIDIHRIITKDEEKLKGYVKLHLNTDATLENDIAKISMSIPKEIQGKIEEKIRKLIPSIKEIEFLEDKSKK